LQSTFKNDHYFDTGLEEGLACVHPRYDQCVFCTFEGSVGVFTAVASSNMQLLGDTCG